MRRNGWIYLYVAPVGLAGMVYLPSPSMGRRAVPLPIQKNRVIFNDTMIGEDSLKPGFSMVNNSLAHIMLQTPRLKKGIITG